MKTAKQAFGDAAMRIQTMRIVLPAFIGLGLVTSCDGPLVRLSPSPVDPMLTQVVLTIAATDPSGQLSPPQPHTFTSGPFDSLGVSFPAGTRGLTTYQVDSYSGAGCQSATGNTILNLDGDGVFDLPVTMTATPLCGSGATLSVNVTSVLGASGSVTSTPAGINCQGTGSGCSAVFAKGTQVRLSAQPANAFAGWAGGSCEGTSDCTFSLSGETSIQAVFSTCSGWCRDIVPTGITANLNAIAGTTSGNILVVGDAGTALFWNGAKWQQQPLPQSATPNLYGVAAKPGGSTIYAAGDGGTILALSSGSTSFTPIKNSSTATLRAVGIGLGGNPNTFFVGDAGTGLVVPPGGTSASSKISTGTTLYAVSQTPNIINASNRDDLFIVGMHGYAQDWIVDGSLTAQMGSPGANISGDIFAVVCGMGTHYAAGVGGALLSRPATRIAPSGNANNWQTVAKGLTTQTLRGLWELDDNNVFAVGDNGTILHYDGNAWLAMTSNVTVNLRAVWGTSKTNIYAVGDNGTILHYLP